MHGIEHYLFWWPQKWFWNLIANICASNNQNQKFTHVMFSNWTIVDVHYSTQVF